VWSSAAAYGGRGKTEQGTQRRADPARVAAGGSWDEGERDLPAPRRPGRTFYTWRNKYGGLEISETRRLRQLQQKSILHPFEIEPPIVQGRKTW
jgi:hypothetical protein